MIERNLPILATRKATAVRVDAFRAVPLTLEITIPDEIGSLAGATILRAEIRSSRVDLSATALAGSSITAPIGQSFELTFTSAQMNQSLSGEESAQFWLVVYATYPPGAVTGSTDLELDVFASIDLVLHEHAASLTAPSPPNAAIALTKTQADLLYMPIGGGTPGTGTVTSVAVNNANGVSAVVTDPTGDVAMIFSLGAITPSSVSASGNVSGANLSTFGNVSGTWAGTVIALAKGGTGATTAAGARTALELGGLAQQSTITSSQISDSTAPGRALLTGATAAAQRTSLELGTIATQDSASFLESDFAGNTNITTVGIVTAGTWSAGTIALAKGGTGATTAAGARTALELGSLATLSPTGTQDATTYLRGDGVYATNLAIITETTTARTLALADNRSYIRCTNAGATTITVPLQSFVAWVDASTISFRRTTGAGVITLTGASGVTISGNTASSVAAEGVFAIVRTGLNTWDFV